MDEQWLLEQVKELWKGHWELQGRQLANSFVLSEVVSLLGEDYQLAEAIEKFVPVGDMKSDSDLMNGYRDQLSLFSKAIQKESSGHHGVRADA